MADVSRQQMIPRRKHHELQASLESGEVIADLILDSDVLADVPVIGTAFKMIPKASILIDALNRTLTTLPRLSLLLWVAAMVQACALTSAVMVDPAEKLPPNPDAKILFEIPERAFRVIAFVDASESSCGPSLSWQACYYERLREKAAEIGADAVIPKETGIEYSSGSLILVPSAGLAMASQRETRYVKQGYAIKFTSP